MSTLHIDRRAFLRGLGGVGLALPVLDAMGAEVTTQAPRRFCAIYTANGMSLPKSDHDIPEWSWFPAVERNGEFVFGMSTQPLSPFRKQLSFMGGLYHPSGPKADPHLCSDMWLTGAPLHNPKPGTFNSAGLDQVAFSFLKHLATYANGRSLTYNELNYLKQDGVKLRAGGYRMQDMIRYVAHSKMFLEK